MKNLKYIVVASLVSGVVAMACQEQQNNAQIGNGALNDKEMEKKEIYNGHEWAPLKEVVVGRWVKGTFNTPSVDMSMQEAFPYIPAASWKYLAKAEHQLLSDVYPEDDQRYYDEQENLVRVLDSLGVKVRRPDEIEFPVTATTQCYSRDPIITIGNKFIITNLNFEGRRQETGNYRRIALELARNYNGEVISMPANKAGYSDKNVYLEGGDVFVDGNHVYVGVSGNASNDNGIEWLRGVLGDENTVHKIPLKSNVLHLDCAMMLMNATQGIICKEDFIDYEALPDRLKNREWVEVEPEQAQIMATNGISVDPQTVIMIDHFPKVIEKVRELGITVVEVPFEKGNYFGGGLRCSYQPIYRQQ